MVINPLCCPPESVIRNPGSGIWTGSFTDEIGPDRPEDRTRLLPEILIDDTAHEVVIERDLQGHAVDLPGAERLEVAADVLDAPIGRLGPGLDGVVVADVDRLAVHLASMDLEDLVLQDRGSSY